MTTKLFNINCSTWLGGSKNACCKGKFCSPFGSEQPFVALLSSEKSMQSLSPSLISSSTNNNALGSTTDAANPYISSILTGKSMHQNFRYLWLILVILVIMLVLFIWLLFQIMLDGYGLTIPETANTIQPIDNNHSTLISLQVFSNGSVQVKNVSSPNENMDPDLMTTTMSWKYDNQQMENERILARERVKQNHLNYIREQLMSILLAGRTPPSSNVTASTLTDDVVKIKQVVENGPPPAMSTSLQSVMPIGNAPFLNSENNNNNNNNNDANSVEMVSFIKNNESSLPSLSLQPSSSSSSREYYYSSEIYAQRLQSFYPSCDLTVLNFFHRFLENNNNNNNNNENEMKLYFDLTIPKSADLRTHITIMWAKLRLYIFDGPKCINPEKNNLNDDNLQLMAMCESNNKLIISLYQYVQPLKENGLVNNRLVDRRIISASFRGHLEFNIQSVINDWQNPLNNYGLMIRIEDRFNTPLMPSNFIYQMNCSDPVLPIPNLAEIYGETILKNETKNGQNEINIRSRYPTLDLMTMESVRENNIEFSTLFPDTNSTSSLAANS